MDLMSLISQSVPRPNAGGKQGETVVVAGAEANPEENAAGAALSFPSLLTRQVKESEGPTEETADQEALVAAGAATMALPGTEAGDQPTLTAGSVKSIGCCGLPVCATTLPAGAAPTGDGLSVLLTVASEGSLPAGAKMVSGAGGDVETDTVTATAPAKLQPGTVSSSPATEMVAASSQAGAAPLGSAGATAASMPIPAGTGENAATAPNPASTAEAPTTPAPATVSAAPQPAAETAIAAAGYEKPANDPLPELGKTEAQPLSGQQTVPVAQNEGPDQPEHTTPDAPEKATPESDALLRTAVAQEQLTVADSAKTAAATEVRPTVETPTAAAEETAPATDAALASGPRIGTPTATPANSGTVAATSIRAQVVQHLAASLTGTEGEEKISLQLNPEHLGQVEIQLSGRENTLTVVITATGGEAEKALREGVKELAEGIVERSTRWQNVEIRVDQRNTEDQRQQRGQDGRRDRQEQDGRREEQAKRQNENRDGARRWAQFHQEG